MPQDQQYDVIIVGAGPAGLAAGLYAARDRYKTLLLERNGLPGGQILLTERIENYPGYEQITGPDLIDHQRKQVEAFGAEIRINQAVDSIRRDDSTGLLHVVVNGGEANYTARAIILTPGSDYRHLGCQGELDMRNVGKVSYCATCDGAFYRDKEILTVGGGNTAVEDTIYLAKRFARKVTMVHRRREFRAQQVLVEELNETAKSHDLTLKLPYILEKIVPTSDGQQIDHVEIRDLTTDQSESLHVDGVFIFVGMVPNTGFLKGIVEINPAGYIVADPASLKTSMPGVFVAGDCRDQAAMQLATAVGDGVVAAMMLKQYFRNPDAWTVPQRAEPASGW